MRLKRLAYFLLATLLHVHAKSLHHHTHHKAWKVNGVVKSSINNYTKSGKLEHAGAKRTWECHRGCLRFCLPSCKKSCCQPGAKDFTPSMIQDFPVPEVVQEIEGFQGELKGSLEQRNSINDDTEIIQAFACGQFCSPECSPSCTIGCCTGAIPKDVLLPQSRRHTPLQLSSNITANQTKDNTTDVQPKHVEPEQAAQIKLEKPSKSKIIMEMPCGEYCSAQCTPTCTVECCNSRGETSAPVKNPSGMRLFTGEISSSYEPLEPVHEKKLMYTKPMGSCHLDCEKLCLPACEFVCCVPTKMRSLPFTKEVEMEFGLRKRLD